MDELTEKLAGLAVFVLKTSLKAKQTTVIKEW